MNLLLPGLTAVGIQGEFLALPAGDAVQLEEFFAALQKVNRLPLFQFEIEKEDARQSDDETSSSEVEAPVRFGALLSQSMLLKENQNQITSLPAGSTHALLLSRSGRKGLRSENIFRALLRWIVFADASPNRLFTLSVADCSQRESVCRFLQEIVGKRRDSFAVKLRRALRGFEMETEEGYGEAWHWLREAVLLQMRLPTLAQSALLADPHHSLSDLERRELIYMARAGRSELKVLALRRLQTEREYRDVRNTLEQMRYDSDGWVRSAAQVDKIQG